MRITLLTLAVSLLALIVYYIRRVNSLNNGQATGFVRSFSKAGAPDQMEQTELDDFENSKMVSEGSQFGVQYFNEMMHD